MPECLASVQEPLQCIVPATVIEIEYPVEEEFFFQNPIPADSQGPVHVFTVIDLGESVIPDNLPPHWSDVTGRPQVLSLAVIPVLVFD